MSRKNLFAHADAAPPSQTKALAATAHSPPLKPIAAVGKLGAIIREMNDDAERAAALQIDLASSTHIVEIDPALIDPSPIRDRLDDTSSDEAEGLRRSIATDGQRVPVLVRPRPEMPGRYLAVYGHRRIQAAVSLGRKVRAVVSDLSDDDAFVAQGQENNERKSTSFIEKSLFAKRLSEHGLNNLRIASALAASPSVISEAIKIAERLPENLITAIGPAPSIGRRRWLALIPLIKPDSQDWMRIILAPSFRATSSDARFELVVAGLGSANSTAKSSPSASTLADDRGPYLTIRRSSKVATYTVRLDDSRAGFPSFADWMESRLPSLREEYLSQE